MVVSHGNGRATMYAHLNSVTLPEGTSVTKGQQIALSGATGLGTGAHLHFEVYEGYTPGNYLSGRHINPVNYLRSRQ